MKSLEQNTTYQILTLRLEIFKINERWNNYVKKYSYRKGLHKIDKIRNDLFTKLEVIEKELRIKYESLELTSENIEEIQMISNTLLLYKKFDATLLLKIEMKIAELTAIKEYVSKNYDFKTASYAREEAHQLQKYFNKHKHYLVDLKGTTTHTV